MMGAETKVYTDVHELIAELSRCTEVITTRLHATVAAWVAGVPTIKAIHYDHKIQDFQENCIFYNYPEAHALIKSQLDTAFSLIK